jgi:hypothetical protein
MAEQEVIKHTKKVYKIWNSKEHGFWHKAKEFGIEIFIIVFAVSLSIWLHGWSEHRHQQKEVNTFLLGLRDDLNKDIAEMTDDIRSYQDQKAIFSYLANLPLKTAIARDSLKKYGNSLYNSTWLVPNNGRFEGFKSSGKIGNIEEDSLRNQILDLYQEDIPNLLNSTANYVSNKKEFFSFLTKNRKRVTDSTSNILNILKMDEAQNLSNLLSQTDQIEGRYAACVNKMKAINSKIEALYRPN